MGLLDTIVDALDPTDGEQPFFDAVENILPGENKWLQTIEAIADPFDGSHPLMDGIGNLTGANGGKKPPARGTSKYGTTPGGRPMYCYQMCQAQNRKNDEQARKSIENFYETMKERGTIITGCKVRLTVKSCGRRAAPAKKACKPKAKTCSYRPKPKKKGCGCGM
jgi:hypothetical protein